MPFQAIPLAMHKNTGSPLSKLLLIYLTSISELPPIEDIGGVEPESAPIDFDAERAAIFCQVTVDEVYGALEELERLRLAYTDDQWVFMHSKTFASPRDRWDFVVVALPISQIDPVDRKRIKCGDDQIDVMVRRQRYHCPTCGAHDDDVSSWHVDHIIPRSRGGADVEANCQAICATCNSRKGARVHWVDFLGGRNRG
ncbi:HNH endonuclease signature motif containing protein [uncultured Brevundimonas sp.]|uniref:HNH endonuclease n=1 Tax=uncultured Brevundimonas sp. TaxID=213418 RepID=UPI0025FF9B79|nr:HNH endonuclease signature motif containing protein [uncultured Brevundimonas sp.]